MNEIPAVYNDKVAEILTLNEISSSGESCSFIDLENGWGLKCYDCKSSRDVSYICQKYLAGKGLAPKIGKKFELTDHDGYSWWCFVTEVADTLVEYGIDNKHCFDEDADEHEMDLAEHYELYACNDRDDWIHEVMELTGYYYTDDHAGNWGYVVANDKYRLVCIDFDTCVALAKKIKSGELE